MAKPCSAWTQAGSGRYASIPCRRDAELDHLRQTEQVLGERLGTGLVAAADHHAVLEELSVVDQARRQVGNREPVTADQLAQLRLPHHRIAFEAQMVMGI